MIRMLLAAVMVLGAVSFAHADEPDLEGVKCVVADRPAQASKSADYMGGKVYFCCGNCLAKFKADPSAYAEAAKMQMIKTGQVEQVACPLSGGPMKDGTAVSFAGTSVKFCCPNCKAKFEGASEDEKAAMLTGKFDRAFKVVE